MHTGHKRVLEENYQMMQHWLKYHASQSNNYISHMSTVGDWLQPYSQQPDERRGDTPHSLISMAFYAYSVKLTKQAAEVLGLSMDYQDLHDLYDSICHAFETEFFDRTGRIKDSYTETQTAYLLAIGFDLLSEDIQFKAIPHLVAQIAQAGKHLRTGFLRGDMHFITSNVRGTGNTNVNVHTYRKAGDSEFTITNDCPGGSLERIETIYIVGLNEDGRPYIKKAEGGTNNWINLYVATSGRVFHHGNVQYSRRKNILLSYGTRERKRSAYLRSGI